MQQRDHKAMGTRYTRLTRKIKAVAYNGRPPILLTHIKALLSISDGRASSFFNTFIKIITPPPSLREADFRVQRYEEKPRNSEKNGEKWRKTEKNEELSVNFWYICKNYM